MIRRNTFQRAMVLEEVRKLQNHATADEIYEAVQKVCPTISRATVYRNLQQLCEQGDISRREIPGSADRYDHLTTSHYHARCVQCQRVTDVDMDYLSDLADRIRDTHGFAFSGHDVVFTGICPACQKKWDEAPQ